MRLNDGTGAFTTGATLSVGFQPNSIALGDLNGDGALDVVTANQNNSSVSVLQNTNAGTGTFQAATTLNTSSSPTDVKLGDVDGDGDLDLVGPGGTGATVSVRLNNGQGGFGGSQEVAVAGAASAVVRGDVDSDGDLDILAGSAATPFNNSTVSVRLNQKQAPVLAAYRLNAGAGPLTTSRGTFAADQSFDAANSDQFTTQAPIAGTPDPALYQTERFSTHGVLSYALPVANGKYNVVLHFAELYWTKPGQRVFDINLEGKKVATNYDIVRKVGPLAATTETFTVAVADGVLNIDLSVPYLSGGADQAKLSALEVLSPDGRTPQLASAPQLANAALRGSAAGPLSGLSTYPNPAQNAFTLACTATKAQAATLLLSGPLGNVLLQQAVALQAGSNLVPVRAPNLAAGLYQLTLRLPDGQHQSQRIIIQP